MLVLAILGVFPASAFGILVATTEEDSGTRPPLGFTPVEGELGLLGEPLSVGADDPTVDLGIAIAAEAAEATRFIEELGNQPLPTMHEQNEIVVDDEFEASHAETTTVDPSVHLRGVSCRSNGQGDFSSSEIARLEDRLRRVRCPPEAHRFILAYYRRRFSNIVYREHRPHSACFHRGVERAAEPLRGEGGVVCRTGD
ncbi:MAG: hypothetical protein ACI9KE_001399 [Polyangiales bacterium]|jgi:hypothetical protein